MYVIFFHLNHSKILIYFVFVLFNVGQTTDISKRTPAWTSSPQAKEKFSYENIGELPAHKYGAGGGSGLGKT